MCVVRINAQDLKVSNDLCVSACLQEMGCQIELVDGERCPGSIVWEY